MPDPWADYLEALNSCCDAAKLAAWATRECARQAEKTADYALLTAYHVKESLKSIDKEVKYVASPEK